MKAITVCQPYASLLLEPEFTRPDVKVIENRPLHWSHRGRIVIHAGKSRSWLSSWDIEDEGPLPDPMPFGSAIGICDLADCVHIDQLRLPSCRWHYLARSMHANGPWCLIMLNPRRFEIPIPFKGALGPWDFPDHLLPEGF